MNYDELAFLNQQLAGMLKSGIPLEGALRQLCADMKSGALRTELKSLEADLSKGTPFQEAVQRRQLPELYRQMVSAGARANDLPGTLTLLADYYSRLNALWIRLKGLMTYPAIVLVAAMGVSIGFAWLLNRLAMTFSSDMSWMASRGALFKPGMVWVFPGLLATGGLAVLAVFVVPSLRQAARWRLPGIKEAGLAQLASTLAVMLRGGLSLRDALDVMIGLERPGALQRELRRWRSHLAEGRAKFQEIATGSPVVPPLFIWLVASGGEDLSGGFSRAAEIYQARTNYRSDMLLYMALPVATLFLGLVIMLQAQFIVQLFTTMMNALGSFE